jgi:cobalt-zinc-cadmium efflux system outer membrane protein
MASRLTHRLAAIACTALLGTWLPGHSTAQSRPVDIAGAPPTSTALMLLPDPLTLRAALDLALRIHPDLGIAGANLAVARADSAFARVPTFNPEVELQSVRGGQTLGSGTEGTLEVGVSQELELWGKRGARQSVAANRSLTSAAEWRAKVQEIESEVRARFERALFLQDRAVVVDELADLDRRVVLATQARVRDGSITPVTGRLTELDLLRLEAQGRRTRSDLRQALVALGLAIGQELPEPTRLGGDARADSLQAPEDSVVAVALRVRGTGEALRRLIAARQAELRLAEREARPNLTLGVGLARERRSFSSGDFTGDPAIVGGIAGASSTDNLWTARISAPLPLWQRNQAGRARASAEIARSQADYDRYRLRTQLEVRGAVRRFEDAAGLYRLYLERSTRVRQDLVLIREAYTDGRISLDSYLTQKGRLVDTLLGQLEAGDGYWDARGQLEAVVGLDLARLNAGGAR